MKNLSTSFGWVFFLLGVMGSYAFKVSAASLETSPVHLYLTHDKPTTVLTLRNHGKEPITLSLASYTWENSQGKDVYEKTSTVIVNPPIVSVQPNDYQIIRVGLRPRWIHSPEELHYRIILTEMVPTVQRKATGVHTRLQINLPVFVTPHPIIKRLVWRIYPLESDRFKIELTNQGNIHTQIASIQIGRPIEPESDPEGGSAKKRPRSDGYQETFSYVFPHRMATWMISCRNCRGSRVIKLTAQTDQGKETHYLHL